MALKNKQYVECTITGFKAWVDEDVKFDKVLKVDNEIVSVEDELIWRTLRISFRISKFNVLDHVIEDVKKVGDLNGLCA